MHEIDNEEISKEDTYAIFDALKIWYKIARVDRRSRDISYCDQELGLLRICDQVWGDKESRLAMQVVNINAEILYLRMAINFLQGL